jgi:hypothetical protein
VGRALLILCAATLLAACDAVVVPDRERVTDGGVPVGTDGSGLPVGATDPHADLPCAACHNGPVAGDRIAGVPRESCATSGCHEEGGPSQVSTQTATFQHRDHGRDGEVFLTCTGCHTHTEGRTPLHVSLDACALCHLPDIRTGGADECRLCHLTPQHVAMTSQGMPVPHSSLPWIETGCVRCHYDVSEAQTRVETTRCLACHDGDAGIVDRGIATDLHPSHNTMSCVSCHEGDAHRVRAMSTAVQLACADCHATEHDIAVGADAATAVTCNGCHETVHQPQQRMLLGMLPGEPASPSSKFIAGMTCRSCHVRTAASDVSGDAVRGHADACASCHRTEYRQVLDWWVEGTRSRTRSVGAFVQRAAGELAGAGPDSVAALIASSQAMLSLVEDAGGHHNLEFTDRIFRESVRRVSRAYALAGRVPPAAPALGSPAHEGMCSYCHYSPNDPWDFRRMSPEFHGSLPGARR